MPRLATRYVDPDRSSDGGAGAADRRSDSFDGRGLLTVETDAGTCHLSPGTHGDTTAVPDAAIEAVDGLVLEEAGTRYERLRLDELRDQRQYEQVLRTNLDQGRVPVFVVDIPPAGGREAYHEGRFVDEVVELVAGAVALAAVGGLGFALGIVLAPLLCIPLLMVALLHVLPGSVARRPGPIGGLVRRTLAYGQVVNGYSLAGARSAAVAELLDEHLLPFLRAENGSRPALFVDYGFAHLDIYAYLRHPRLRRFVLGAYRWHNRADRDWSYLNAALAFEFEGLAGWNDSETVDGVRHKRVLVRFEAPPGSGSEQPDS